MPAATPPTGRTRRSRPAGGTSRPWSPAAADDRFRRVPEGHPLRPRAERLRLETRLVADLLDAPLGESLAGLEGLGDAARAEQLRRRVVGRSVFFDGFVRGDPDGRWFLLDPPDADGLALQLVVRPARRPRLDLAAPRRLVFGMRVAAAALTRGRGWTVTADPDSVLLVTDPAALGSTSVPLDDELVRLIREQAAASVP